MDEENVQPNETNEEPEQIEETLEVEETPQELPKEEQPAEVEESTDDDYPEYTPAEIPSAPGLDAIPRDKDGNYDAEGFAKWVQAQTEATRQQTRAELRDEMRRQQQEQKAWEKIYEKYPQVKESKKLQNQIHNARIGDLYRGGKGDLVKAAEGFFTLIDEAKQAGRTASQEHITIQESAHVETASTKGDPSNTRDRELMSRISSRNRVEAESATTELMKQWIEQGKI